MNAGRRKPSRLQTDILTFLKGAQSGNTQTRHVVSGIGRGGQSARASVSRALKTLIKCSYVTKGVKGYEITKLGEGHSGVTVAQSVTPKVAVTDSSPPVTPLSFFHTTHERDHGVAPNGLRRMSLERFTLVEVEQDLWMAHTNYMQKLSCRDQTFHGLPMALDEIKLRISKLIASEVLDREYWYENGVNHCSSIRWPSVSAKSMSLTEAFDSLTLPGNPPFNDVQKGLLTALAFDHPFDSDAMRRIYGISFYRGVTSAVGLLPFGKTTFNNCRMICSAESPDLFWDVFKGKHAIREGAGAANALRVMKGTAKAGRWKSGIDPYKPKLWQKL